MDPESITMDTNLIDDLGADSLDVVELIMSLEDVPYIVAAGRKGGSNIAACIVNALLYKIDDRR